MPLKPNSSSSVRLLTFLYPIGYQRAQFFRRGLHYASGDRKFLRQSAQPPWGSVYIVIHRETVSFYQNSSVWLDTQDARGWDRSPSNFTLDLVSDRSANIYISSISSLIHISLKIMDTFCLHIFWLILSNCRIDLMISGGNWLVKLP